MLDRLHEAYCTHDFVGQAVRKGKQNIGVWREDTDSSGAMVLERSDYLIHELVHGIEVEPRVIPVSEIKHTTVRMAVQGTYVKLSRGFHLHCS